MKIKWLILDIKLFFKDLMTRWFGKVTYVKGSKRKTWRGNTILY